MSMDTCESPQARNYKTKRQLTTNKMNTSSIADQHRQTKKKHSNTRNRNDANPLMKLTCI